ncbi:hypothetical protein TPA0910_04290 [Streptomyces hygroscopicus subsp. sporocinereus]|uniref:Integrase n=1 Tax=Streptomyces hygroscopicus TaxID=1912 RepID=A0ABQ3TRP4_STRHY|nr:hypothetical protein TPA0910_04290 [Streptomyces hygroscopicus]
MEARDRKISVPILQDARAWYQSDKARALRAYPEPDRLTSG